jgi:DNA-binding winged helix-turn-helix (wHTH) protein/Tol biopolymer transport system component
VSKSQTKSKFFLNSDKSASIMAIRDKDFLRNHTTAASRIYEFGTLRLDTGQRILTHLGSALKLKPKTLEVLECLVRQSNKVIEKGQLMQQVWPDSFVEDANLTVHISTLRKIFAETGNHDVSIETFPKIGYKLNANVREVREEDPESSTARQPTAANPEIGALRGADIAVAQPAPAANAYRTRIIMAALVLGALLFGSGYFLNKWYAGRRSGPPIISRVPGTEQSSSIALSPNGEYIAHSVSANGKRTLTMTNINSGSSLPLLPPDEALFYGMTFSRDNSFLYFVKSGPEHTSLYKIPILGGTVTHVLDRADNRISFSPDGSRFCFVRKLADQVTAIMTANADGSDEREVARRIAPRFYSGFDISWSPDGRLIANAAGESGTNPDMQLIGVEVETGKEIVLNDRKWAGVDGLEWLRDGSGLVAGIFEGPTSPTQVWFVPYPSGEMVRITNDLENHGSVGVSADGSTIMAGQFKDNTSVWLVPAGDPSAARLLPTGKHHKFNWVRWLPDGGFTFGSDAGSNRDVWRMNLDGSGEQMLTNGPQSNVMPVATADGSYIVFAAFRDNNDLFELWRMNADGSNEVQLTPTGGGAWQPSLTPDGRWAFYTSGKMDGAAIERRIWKVAVKGGSPVLFIDVPAYQADVSPDGKFVACWIKPGEKAKPQAAVFSIEGGPAVKIFEALTGNRLDWTPDGKGISFIRTDNGVSNVWTQPIDGGPVRQETQFASETIRSFDWSSDGRLLVSRFHKTRDCLLIRNFR